MATTFASLGLQALSDSEKVALVDDLSEEVETTVPPASWLTPTQRTELKRRIADLDANLGDTIPWEDVEAEIERRFGR